MVDNVTGCELLSTPYVVVPYASGELDLSLVSSVTCHGASDGSLSLSVNNYTGSYDYEVLNASGGVVSSGSQSSSSNPLLVTGLPSGIYTVIFCGLFP